MQFGICKQKKINKLKYLRYTITATASFFSLRNEYNMYIYFVCT